MKPDALLEDSRAYFTDGDLVAGSSCAAAYVAGSVVVLKAAFPSLRPADLLRIASTGPSVASKARTATLRPGQSSLRLWQVPPRARMAEILRGLR